LKELTTRVATKTTATDVRTTDKKATVIVAGVLAPLAADASRPAMAVAPVPVAVPGAPAAKAPDAVLPPVAVAPVLTLPPAALPVVQPKPQRTAQPVTEDGRRMRLGATAAGRDPAQAPPQRSTNRAPEWKSRIFDSSR
jgi:hypothetical protein